MRVHLAGRFAPRFCVAGRELSVLKVGHTKFQTSRSRGVPVRNQHEPVASDVEIWHGICYALHSSRGLVASKSIPYGHNQDGACYDAGLRSRCTRAFSASMMAPIVSAHRSRQPSSLTTTAAGVSKSAVSAGLIVTTLLQTELGTAAHSLAPCVGDIHSLRPYGNICSTPCTSA